MSDLIARLTAEELHIRHGVRVVVDFETVAWAGPKRLADLVANDLARRRRLVREANITID